MPNGGLYRPTDGVPHRTGEPWHPSCHGGKTQINRHVSLYPCEPKARSPGSRGTTPCASHEARCRAAVTPQISCFPTSTLRGVEYRKPWGGGLYRPTDSIPHRTGEPWHPSCHGGKTPAKLHVVRIAPRPMGAVWGAGHRSARPASREAFRRAAVVSRPSRMSPEYPARHRRAVRGAGVLPLPCPAICRRRSGRRCRREAARLRCRQ